MRTPTRAALVLGTVAALSLGAAAPAGAQETPTLGFEIDRTEGAPGDEVNGQVDVDDVAEYCAVTPEEVQARFGELTALMQEMGPAYMPAPEDEYWDIDFLSYSFIGAVAMAIEFDMEGATGTLLDQSFVMTFADIATQSPVGERANFDPAVGTATVTVPDVDPGLWAVAATCVEPSLDQATIEQAIAEGSVYIKEALGLGDQVPADWTFPDPDSGLQFLFDSAPILLEPLMVPQAMGFQIFCVVDGTGACPTDEPPPSGPDPSTPPPADPGDDPGPGGVPTAPPARPVVAVPTFTG
ncbi:MAG: hypothetical protein JXA83_02075 [Acidimicrobiales bacterium]|nr:hypothetical protein [Acidimicrobiales bacterium]